MAKTKKMSLGCERYFQGPGCADRIGEESLRIGKRVLVVAGEKAWSASGDVISESLNQKNIRFHLHRFSGYCSETNVQAIIHDIHVAGVELLIGIGGGKCMDAVKSAAELAKIPYLLVPTSAATCAANVKLCVWYTDEGVCCPGMFAQVSAEAVLVDTRMIGAAPARLLAAGMADALAKYPELDYSRRWVDFGERSAALESAVAIAKNNIDLLLYHGPQAILEMQGGAPSANVEKVISVCIGMTGLTSNLVAGVHQLAVAHMFHDGVASLYHDSRVKYLHGEVVAVGVLLQLASNGYDCGYIDDIRQFLIGIGVPVCLSQLEIAPTEQNRDTLFRYITERGFDQPDMKEAIWSAFHTILK